VAQPVVPVQRPGHGAPLALETFRATVDRRTAEIEHVAARTHRQRQGLPVQEHVHAQGIEGTQRGRPGDLHACPVLQQDATGCRLIADVYDHDMGVGAQVIADRFEQATRVDGRAEIAHVAREYVVERRHQFVAPDDRRGPVLQGLADLRPQFRPEFAPQRIRVARQRPFQNPLVGAHRCRIASRRGVAELDMADAELSGEFFTCPFEAGPCSRIVRDGTAVIEIRQRDEEIAERPTAQTHERQDARNGALRVAGTQVIAGLAEHLVDDVPEFGAMVQRGIGRSGGETVPVVACPVILAGRDGDQGMFRRASSFRAGHPSVGRAKMPANVAPRVGQSGSRGLPEPSGPLPAISALPGHQAATSAECRGDPAACGRAAAVAACAGLAARPAGET